MKYNKENFVTDCVTDCVFRFVLYHFVLLFVEDKSNAGAIHKKKSLQEGTADSNIRANLTALFFL